jgi:hypothetical protein
MIFSAVMRDFQVANSISLPSRRPPVSQGFNRAQKDKKEVLDARRARRIFEGIRCEITHRPAKQPIYPIQFNPFEVPERSEQVEKIHALNEILFELEGLSDRPPRNQTRRLYEQ